LREGETLICPRCVEVADDHTDTATISPGDLADLDELGEDELTSEQEYGQALGAEVDWDLLADGILTRGTGSTRRGGRAWRRP